LVLYLESTTQAIPNCFFFPDTKVLMTALITLNSCWSPKRQATHYISFDILHQSQMIHYYKPHCSQLPELYDPLSYPSSQPHNHCILPSTISWFQFSSQLRCQISQCSYPGSNTTKNGFNSKESQKEIHQRHPLAFLVQHPHSSFHYLIC